MTRNAMLAVLLCAPATLACKRTETISADATASSQPAPPPAPKAPSPLEVIRTKKTMADALLVAGPLMAKDEHNESNLGTLLFATWATDHLRWADVDIKKDETSYGACQKDIETERMKRLFITGTIIQINAFKSDIGKWYTGLMQNYAGDLFHFHAVRSTNEIVKGSNAKFYGIVTGWFDYDNSAGGVGHAVDVVGMFSLPENRAAQ